MTSSHNQADLLRAVEPVQRIETDPQEFELEPGIALCLSGGGFRAICDAASRKHVSDGIERAPKFPYSRVVN